LRGELVRGGADDRLSRGSAVGGLAGGERRVLEVAVAGLGAPAEVVEGAVVGAVVEGRDELGDVAQVAGAGEHGGDGLLEDVAGDEVAVSRLGDAEQLR